jgi:hypothetical protein
VNGTNGLNQLSVTNVKEKPYPNEEAYPLWGVEDSGLTMYGISPVWGIISPAYENYPNISFVKQRSLYLIGYAGTLSQTLNSGTSWQNMPASDFPVAAMNTIFGSSSLGGVASREWPFDLVGRASMSIFMRWQNLSSKAETAGTIINLIWTDLAASAVVGTKGALGPSNHGLANETIPITIQPFAYRIKYHFAFGIPAFILATVLLLASLLALAAGISRRSSIAKVKLRLQQVSAGRILTTLLYPEYATLTMSAEEWSRFSGDKNINLGGMPEVVPEMRVVEVERIGSLLVSDSGDNDKMSPLAPVTPMSRY